MDKTRWLSNKVARCPNLLFTVTTVCFRLRAWLPLLAQNLATCQGSYQYPAISRRHNSASTSYDHQIPVQATGFLTHSESMWERTQSSLTFDADLPEVTIASRFLGYVKLQNQIHFVAYCYKIFYLMSRTCTESKPHRRRRP
jgi:hypothetical protein